MTLFAFLNALEVGVIFGLVALGLFIGFRVLNFPDLTVDGSFASGGAVVAALIVTGWNPWAATAVAVAFGMLCGLVTALLNRRYGMIHLLAGILTTIGLFSINLRIMGAPNIPLLSEETILTPVERLGWGTTQGNLLFASVVCALAVVGVFLFLRSEYGLAMRATGANPVMAQANGVNVDLCVYAGLAISNGLVALGGALFAQAAGFADVGMGTGVVLYGLAAVILGEVVLRSRSMMIILISCVLGSIIYRVVVGFALNAQVLGLRSSDLRLVTAVLVAVAFIISSRKHLRHSGTPIWRKMLGGKGGAT